MSAFFTEIIGLRLLHLVPDGSFAELRDSNNLQIMIRKVDSKHNLSKLQYGYAPIVNFEINANEDLDFLIEKACGFKQEDVQFNQQFKCYLDGEIVHDDFIKIACLKIEEAVGSGGGGGPTISITQRLN